MGSINSNSENSGLIVNNSIIVASDTHFGHDDSEYMAFADFLKWLHEVEQNNGGKAELLNGRSTTILPPDKFILLGDIHELWIPIVGNPAFVKKHSEKAAERMKELECEMIYVLGNHDATFTDLDGVSAIEELVRDKKLRVIHRHYPEKIHEQSIQIRGDSERKYAFLHGHQFDLKQKLRNLVDMLSFVSSRTQKYFAPHGWIAMLLFILFFHGILLAPLLTDFPYSVVSYIMIAMLGALLIGWVISHIAEPIWDLTKGIRGKTIEEVVKTPGYYNKEKGKLINANVLVFGHTHVPDKTPLNYENTGKMFVNTGAWKEKARMKEWRRNAWSYLPAIFLLSMMVYLIVGVSYPTLWREWSLTVLMVSVIIYILVVCARTPLVGLLITSPLAILGLWMFPLLFILGAAWAAYIPIYLKVRYEAPKEENKEKRNDEEINKKKEERNDEGIEKVHKKRETGGRLTFVYIDKGGPRLFEWTGPGDPIKEFDKDKFIKEHLEKKRFTLL